jgi:hypothetical protein
VTTNPDPRPRANTTTRVLARRLLPWVITVVCFGYLYTRLAGAASREGAPSVPAYLAGIFADVPWGAWLLLMVGYSFFYLLIDTAVLWRVVNWFNARVSYADLLPVRASTYIISILNEQVGKGAIAVYLNRRDGVPGWQLGSSILFIMVCEFYYLLAWATIGVFLRWSDLPEALGIFRAIPTVGAGALVVAAGALFIFRSERFRGVALLDRHLFHSFRRAAPWQYLTIMLLRSPSLLLGVFVYSTAAGMFGVEIPFLDMLSYLPVVIFGTFIPGPFRAVAVTMWPTLFPEHAGEMTLFGFVQHNFFVLFNAAIGLVFLRRANRELFDGRPESAGT